MIRLAMILDANHGVAALEDWRDQNSVQAWAQLIYRADAVAVTRRGFNDLHLNSRRLFVLTQDPSWAPATGKPCRDPGELVRTYESSSEELCIAGGRTLFERFLPHCAVIDIAILAQATSSEPFTAWNQGEFELVDQKKRDGFETLKLFRK